MALPSRMIWQPDGSCGKAALDVLDQSIARQVGHGPELFLEAELRSVLSDEVQDREYRLGVGTPQSPSQLLEENGGAVGGS